MRMDIAYTTAPVAEVSIVSAFFCCQFRRPGIGACKTRESEKICSTGFLRSVGPGNAQPQAGILFNEQEMPVVVVPVQKKAVVGKRPEPARELGHIRTADLSGRGTRRRIRSFRGHFFIIRRIGDLSRRIIAVRQIRDLSRRFIAVRRIRDLSRRFCVGR